MGPYIRRAIRTEPALQPLLPFSTRKVQSVAPLLVQNLQSAAPLLVTFPAPCTRALRVGRARYGHGWSRDLVTCASMRHVT